MNFHAQPRATASVRRFLSLFHSTVPALILLASTLAIGPPALAEIPATGAQAPNFTLVTPTGHSVSLVSETNKGTTVLIVLRGFPGYQCPYCVRQVGDFIEHAQQFASKHVNVLLVYPGPPAALDQQAKEFLAKQSDLPANLQLAIDPDYKMTNQYGLRWDAPHETAFPSTFLLDTHRRILFEKISHSHGDRTTAEEVLAQIPTK